MTRKPPEIMEVDASQLEGLLRRAEEGMLEEKDIELIRAVFQSYVYITGVVENKKTTIHRLRKLIFGAGTEKTAAVLGSDAGSSSDEPGDGDDSSAGDSRHTDVEATDGSTRKGHGRNSADAYRGADQIDVPHESLQAGDACPHCEQGKVYELHPGVLVRVVGQAPLQAKVYRLQKLRCHLCGRVFTADAPPDAGARKYDETAASMIALLKYGTGMPFNRLTGLQRSMEIPLPASTQWDVIAAHASIVFPAYEELIRQAAQGEVLHNDDTTVKILELMGKHRQAALDEDDDLPGRTGLFTSGVISTLAGRRVALFFSGRKHAGENLADVLQQRAKELQQPIQMCDALSRNLPGELQTIVANCLAHGRRRFVEVSDRFEDECRYVLETLRIVYRNDAEAEKRNLSPAKRLRLHRIKSQHPMARLHTWLKRQFDEKLVEPNSAFGETIQYMLNHWEKLTLFLREPGAPLDNNVCERALKKSILHRKNALFFRTRRGAQVGDMYMSLIHTCELNRANAFDYLTELHRNADLVEADPASWMPWTYPAAGGQEASAVAADA